MRKLLLFIPLALFIGMGFFLWKGLYLDPREIPSALVDRPMPAFELPSLTEPERKLSAADLKGEVALVNVWATWCPTCKEEHSFLNQLAQQGITIYGINYKDEPVKATAWLQRYLNPYREVILDQEGRLGLDLGVYGAPETYVIDAQGTIRYRHVGAVDAKVWKSLEEIMQQVQGAGA
ncbi:MAG: DsbE family thiol:disulfide interchange protein [Oceanospirillaceae bacterium]|nr:DsbE family thiol:disulfide interchange protein [Oceanospirillaceae bacterium]